MGGGSAIDELGTRVPAAILRPRGRRVKRGVTSSGMNALDWVLMVLFTVGSFLEVYGGFMRILIGSL